MGEDNGLVAVEIINDTLIGRGLQQGDRQHVVVAHAAQHDPTPGRRAADHGDIPPDQSVPGLGHVQKDHLVQGLKGHLLAVWSEAFGYTAPEGQKTLLQRFIVKEFSSVHVLLQGVEGIAIALMEVDEHMESVLSAPPKAAFQIAEARL